LVCNTAEVSGFFSAIVVGVGREEGVV